MFVVKATRLEVKARRFDAKASLVGVRASRFAVKAACFEAKAILLLLEAIRLESRASCFTGKTFRFSRRATLSVFEATRIRAGQVCCLTKQHASV